MSTVTTESYGSATAITITLASLGASTTVGRESTAVDNVTPGYLDALVQVKVKTGSGTQADLQAVQVYIAGSVDAGTTWPDVVTGSDANVTPQSPTQLTIAQTINCPTASTTYVGEPFSVARLFGGIMPTKWSVIIRNRTNQTLDSTAGNHKVQYIGVNALTT
jgi:hypothetical protein